MSISSDFLYFSPSHVVHLVTLQVAKERVQIRLTYFDAPTYGRTVTFSTLSVRLWLPRRTLRRPGAIERLQIEWRSTQAISC